jgi:hypothetical protein
VPKNAIVQPPFLPFFSANVSLSSNTLPLSELLYVINYTRRSASSSVFLRLLLLLSSLLFPLSVGIFYQSQRHVRPSRAPRHLHVGGERFEALRRCKTKRMKRRETLPASVIVQRYRRNERPRISRTRRTLLRYMYFLLYFGSGRALQRLATVPFPFLAESMNR